MNPLDYCLHALNSSLIPLPKDSFDYQLLKTYINNTWETKEQFYGDTKDYIRTIFKLT